MAIGVALFQLFGEADDTQSAFGFWALMVFPIFVLGFAFPSHAWRWPMVIVVTLFVVDILHMWMTEAEFSPQFPLVVMLFVPIYVGLAVIAQIGAVLRRKIDATKKSR